MKKTYAFLAVLTILSPFLTSLSYAADPAQIVILYGKRSHGSGAHEFKAGSMLLAKNLNEQSDVAIKCTTIAGWPKDPSDILDEADAIIFYNDATRIVSQGWEKINELAAKGTGLMFMHYAVHPSPDQGEKYFKPWMGAYFKNGQSVNPLWKAKIQPLVGHPTARGVESSETIDEYYHSLDFTTENTVLKLGVATPSKENLLTINNLWTETGHNSFGKEQPLIWGIERKDGGRGAGFTGGHFHHNWAFDELRQLVLNTIVWVAGSEVPANGIAVKPLTEEELNANLDDYGENTVRLALPTPESRPTFTPNAYLPPNLHKDARKDNPEWFKRRGQLAHGEIVPVK